MSSSDAHNSPILPRAARGTGTLTSTCPKSHIRQITELGFELKSVTHGFSMVCHYLPMDVTFESFKSSYFLISFLSFHMKYTIL